MDNKETAAELVRTGEFDKEMSDESCENRESDIRNYTNQSFTLCMKRQHQVTKNAIGEYQASKCSKHENEITPSKSKTLLYSKTTPRKIKQLSNSNELKFRRKLSFSNPRMPTSFSSINRACHHLKMGL